MKTSIAVFVSLFALAACKQKEEQKTPPEPPKAVDPATPTAPAPTPTPPAPPPAAAKNLVEVATEAGSFKTLLTAVDAAGLTATLAGPGPFTVFAPTDEAFAKVPPDTLKALLADKAALTRVLTYHVVSGAVLAKDVTGLTSAKSLQGADIPIDTSDGVKVAGATVVKADIAASNGVIHVVDTVMMPPN